LPAEIASTLDVRVGKHNSCDVIVDGSHAGGAALPQWLNKKLFVYHGTDSGSVAGATAVTGAILPFFVNLALCRPNTDFGQGFYVTTRLHQAQQWANTRVTSLPAPGLFAVILRFELDRDWLAGLQTLGFVRATRDFWDLVTDCRHGFAPHQRLPPNQIPYDVVFGPVTLWPQTLTIGDCDQMSFHTRRAVAGLPQPSLFRRANERDLTRTLF
jgi:hypothetical protein